MNLHFFKKDLPLLSVLFVIGEGLLIFGAIITAAFLRFGGTPASFLSEGIVSRVLLILLICQGCLYYNELYNLKVTDTYLELAFRMTKALGIASILLALIYYLVPDLIIGRGVFFISIALVIPLIVLWRIAYGTVLKKKMLVERIIVVGSGEIARQIIEAIYDRPDTGYDVSAVASTGSTFPPFFSHDVPIFSIDGRLYELARRLHVNKIVVGMDERRGKFPSQDLLRCKLQGMKILEGETLYEQLTGKLFLEKLNPSWLLFSEGFGKSPVTRLAKRATGLVLAFVSLLLSLPLAGIIAVAVKLDSKGPVFFRQKRHGQSGRVFDIYKFRSMIDNAEDESGPCWAEEDDWRLTQVGRILRKYRLDELPQVWNVLRGDMSFVGPRPERPEFVEEIAKQVPYYSQRHTVRPGITGWAQVSYQYGSSVGDALEKLKYDLFYIKNMSLAMDLIIIFKTLKIVLLKSGAR